MSAGRSLLLPCQLLQLSNLSIQTVDILFDYIGQLLDLHLLVIKE